MEQSEPQRAPDRAAAHLLDLLAYSGWPMTIEELRREGVPAPAQAIYELQLAGYEIDRVAVHLDGGHHGTGYRLHTLPADLFAPIERVPAAERSRRRPAHTPARARGRRRRTFGTLA
jgi:hypothetical protein